jgi:predicted RNA-binding protein
MCESKVIFARGGREEIIMEDVTRIEVSEDRLKLYGILGEESEIRGKIVLVDMKGHRVVVE